MTIGQTTITTATIIEHSLLRIGIPLEAQTPEIVQAAKNNLYFIMTNYANRGMTYWCVDQQFITLTEGKVANALPAGTVDILNANYRTLTTTTGTVADATTSTSIIRQFSAATDTVMFKLDSTFSGTVTVSYSTDGVTYTTHSTISHDGTAKWYSVDPTINAVYFKLSVASGTFTVDELVTVSSYVDLPMYRLNRDDYSMLPNKTTQSTPLQFWFDRRQVPVVNLWPSPSSTAASNCVQYFREHQPEDIGALTGSLTIPPRWLQATIWSLSQIMAFEIPNTEPSRVTLATQMAEKALSEVENEERDNSTISIAPDIGVYNA